MDLVLEGLEDLDLEDLDGLDELDFSDDDFVVGDDVSDDVSEPSDVSFVKSKTRKPKEKKQVVSYKCKCAKKYKSIAGLKRHLQSVHDMNMSLFKAEDYIDTLATSPSTSGTSKSAIRKKAFLFDQLWIDEKWDDLFSSSVKSCIESEIHNASFSKHGKMIAQCAETLAHNSDFVSDLKCALSRILLGSCKLSLLSQAKEEVWKLFHSMFVCSISSYHCYKGSFSSQCFTTVLLEIAEFILLQCLKFKGEESQNKLVSVENVTQEELEIIMYLAGYVIFKMKKYILSVKNILKKEKLEAIVSLFSSSSDDTNVKKYRKWTELMSRGGLQTPSDDFFYLIRHIEFIVRGNVANSTDSSAEILLICRLCSVAMENVNVQYFWNKLVPHSSDLSVFLLEKIVKMFLTVRGHS